MIARDEWRPFLRRIVNDGGDISDVARAIKAHEKGKYIQAGAALREEFGLPLTEVLEVIGWAEGPGDGEEGLDRLRSRSRRR